MSAYPVGGAERARNAPSTGLSPDWSLSRSPGQESVLGDCARTKGRGTGGTAGRAVYTEQPAPISSAYLPTQRRKWPDRCVHTPGYPYTQRRNGLRGGTDRGETLRLSYRAWLWHATLRPGT